MSTGVVVVSTGAVVASTGAVVVSTGVVVVSVVVGAGVAVVCTGVVSSAVVLVEVSGGDEVVVVDEAVDVVSGTTTAEVDEDDVDVVEGTAVANILPAAVSAASMSLSDTGFSRSLQPVCIGVRRSALTLESPSEQSDTIHCSTVSSRPSLEATHKSFWFCSPSVLYPDCWIHVRTQSGNPKVTVSSLLSSSPSTWVGRSTAMTKRVFRNMVGSILLYLSFQTNDWVNRKKKKNKE